MYKRRRGATLGLVAACAVIVAILGIAIFLLIKMMGGGRELSNAADAGVLNVAKSAMRTPSKSAMSFSDDVKANFALLGVGNNFELNLMTYNRLVAHAVIVTLNAKQEGTPEAAQNARKTWKALNEVGSYLRGKLSDKFEMETPFNGMASSNSTKMLGNNPVALSDYDTAFMKRGASSNVAFEPALINSFGNSWNVPLNSTGLKQPSTDYAYMSGYTPFSIDLPATGDKLQFCSVTTMPLDRPHLVSLDQFQSERNDDFATGAGIPQETLPPNSFKCVGRSKEINTNAFVSSVACAIVGSTEVSYPAQIKNGVIHIKNGPSVAAPNKPMANKKDDIFAYELGPGIFMTGTRPDDIFTADMSLLLSWQIWNAPPGPVFVFPSMIPEPRPQPDLQQSLDKFFRVDGRPVTAADFQKIKSGVGITCHCYDYGKNPTPECLQLLDRFKEAYDRPGSSDSGHIAPTGWTNVEAMKAEVLAKRVDARTCATVNAPTGKSGVKWYPHRPWVIPVSAPDQFSYNFGVPKSPFEYLQMIFPDNATSGARGIDPYWYDKFTCPKGSPVKAIVDRCREIKPGTSEAEVKTLLSSRPLPLDSSLFIFLKNDRLVMEETPPPWWVPGTTADGTAVPCEDRHDVTKTAVNAKGYVSTGMNPKGDGDFPIPWLQEPPVDCIDVAEWTPSTGYRGLLGTLEFKQTVEGGGEYCAPN